MKKIIYITDAQCGWCYGNSNNISTIYDTFKNSVDFEINVGGLWLKENAPKGGIQLSQYISLNGPRMEQTTGVKIGSGFYTLVKDMSYTFSSLEPSAAVVLVKKLDLNLAFLFAKKVQDALYIDGKRLDKLSTYSPILQELNLDKSNFEKEWLSEENLIKTYAEFKLSTSMAQGFPTLLLQDGKEIKKLASGYFNLENMTNVLVHELGQI